jgi:hypothetical protein
MLKSRTQIIALCSLGVLAWTTAPAGQRQAKASALSAMDQIEIQQLVAQANYALSTGADNGYLYAGLFTSNGAFDKSVGREQLAALARGGRKGTRNLSTNVIIEPSAGGATGKQYEVVISFVAEGREPVMLGSTGRYEDEYVKTSDGWRFKNRAFLPSIPTPEASKAAIRATPSGSGEPPPTPRSVPLQPLQRGAKPSTLTALDYLEIQQLVASYGHALDSGLGREDNGEPYAGLFSPDGVFGRPYTTGHDQLVNLAHTQPHGPQYIRHFLTNMVIEPSPQGAIGRQYLVVIDTAAEGKPGSVLIGGHYEDVYVKTAVGWRFKSRTLYQARNGGQPTQAQ